MEKVANEGAGDKVSEVVAALRSMVNHFQPTLSAESHSSIIAPSVFGSHIENLNISVNTKAPEEQCYSNNNNDEEVKLDLERLLIEDCRENLKASLKRTFSCLNEGTANENSKVSLNSIYTELYVTEGGRGGVNQEHEIRQIEALTKSKVSDEKSVHCNNLFEPRTEHPVRTVLTRGVAGIGKTVATNKFALDWAESKANTDFDFVFPLSLRELNLMRDRKLSFEELLSRFFPEMKGLWILANRKWKTLIILDGLDESRINLDFQNCEILSDVKEPSCLGVLLVNLIRGRLLPVCSIWITSRPAASIQIPGEYIDLVTEIRGFNNPQKEEYFNRKIPNKTIANKIISHIKSCRSLYIMCYIPVFCWMAANVLVKNDVKELPKTVTQMYVHFLALFIDKMKQRLQRSTAGISESLRANLIALGKLAFRGLEKGNLVFYESDLRVHGISGEQESMFSGIYTEIFNNETALSGEKMFSFVHLSVQEFFAALYVYLTFHNENINVLIRRSSVTRLLLRESSEIILYKEAVEKALQCRNGHYDMFLRFLFGLSQEANCSFMKHVLMIKNRTSANTRGEIIKHIKDKIKMGPPPDRCLNLFHCLNELNDRSLVEEIQSFIKAGSVSRTTLTPSQWASLVFVLLTSDEELKEFDLGNYARSQEGLLRMLPVVKAAQIAKLKGCGLTELGAASLSSLLSAAQCKLKCLDVSDNDCGDEGVQRLSEALSSPHCGLEVLGLSLCRVTERGCTFLASALNGSVLKELDLSYNHPGRDGLQLLRVLAEDPHCSLSKISAEGCSESRIGPGPKKYAVHLTLDPATSHKDLTLSDRNRKATRELNPAVPIPNERFSFWNQVLCTKGLTGRCYWETEVDGRACIGVAYARMPREGEGAESRLGQNESSWGLNCNREGFKAAHNGVVTAVPGSLKSNRIGVLLDWHLGKLSFFGFREGESFHIFTFEAHFAFPVFPAFHLAWIGASIHLC